MVRNCRRAIKGSIRANRKCAQWFCQRDHQVCAFRHGPDSILRDCFKARSNIACAPATATVIVRQKKAFGGLDATNVDHSVEFVLTDEGPWIIEVQSGAYVKVEDYPNRGTIKMVSVH